MLEANEIQCLVYIHNQRQQKIQELRIKEIFQLQYKRKESSVSDIWKWLSEEEFRTAANKLRKIPFNSRLGKFWPLMSDIIYKKSHIISHIARLPLLEHANISRSLQRWRLQVPRRSFKDSQEAGSATSSAGNGENNWSKRYRKPNIHTQTTNPNAVNCNP